MKLSDLHLNWGARRQNGKEYRSYSLARSFRENGKNKKTIVLKLGKLSDDELNKWKELLYASKQPDAILTTADDLSVSNHFAYLDVATILEVWMQCGLNEIFTRPGKQETPLWKIAAILVLNRCIDPVCKSKSPTWFQQTALPYLLDLEPSVVNVNRIFRDLPAIEHCKEAICDFLFKKFMLEDPASMKSVFYDLSSTNFHGTKCLLMKWGHCKSGYDNHIVLALVVNSKGMPFYWEVLPGGTPDVTTIIWLLKRLKDKLTNTSLTIVFDRGMVSDENLDLLDGGQIRYISAMDKSQIENITNIDFSLFSKFTIENVDAQIQKQTMFAKLNEQTYYQEIPNGVNVKIEKAIESCRRLVAEANQTLMQTKSSRNRQSIEKKFSRIIAKYELQDIVKIELNEIQLEKKPGNAKIIKSFHGLLSIDEEAKAKVIATRSNRDGYERRYILCFNPQLFRDQHKATEQAIENCYNLFLHVNQELLQAKNSRSRKSAIKKFKNAIEKLKLKNVVDVKLEEVVINPPDNSSEKKKSVVTYRGEMLINEEGRLQAGRLHGFWLLTSNQSEKINNCYQMSASELIEPYRTKVVIESSFRDIKSFIEISPVNVWTPMHVHAHYTVCVLSHLLNRILSIKLHQEKGRLTKDIVSHEKLYETLKHCCFNQINIKNAGIETYSFTKQSDQQKELLNRLGMNHLIDYQALSCLKKKAQRTS